MIAVPDLKEEDPSLFGSPFNVAANDWNLQRSVPRQFLGYDTDKRNPVTDVEGLSDRIPATSFVHKQLGALSCHSRQRRWVS